MIGSVRIRPSDTLAPRPATNAMELTPLLHRFLVSCFDRVICAIEISDLIILAGLRRTGF